MARNINVVDYDVVTITDTAGTIVDRGALSAVPVEAHSFQGILETATARMRGDGVAPTASEGVLISLGDKVTLDINQIDVMNFIRTGATSGVLRGHYFNVEASVLLGG